MVTDVSDFINVILKIKLGYVLGVPEYKLQRNLFNSL